MRSLSLVAKFFFSLTLASSIRVASSIAMLADVAGEEPEESIPVALATPHKPAAM